MIAARLLEYYQDQVLDNPPLYREFRAMVLEGSSLSQRMNLVDKTPEWLKQLADYYRFKGVTDMPSDPADFNPPTLEDYEPVETE